MVIGKEQRIMNDDDTQYKIIQILPYKDQLVALCDNGKIMLGVWRKQDSEIEWVFVQQVIHEDL